MCNINHPKFRCKICAKNIQDKDKAVQACDESSTIFPFNSLSGNKNFLACTNTNCNITQWKDLENDLDSSLILKLSSNLELLVNQFNNVTTENGNGSEKIASSKYYDIDEMHKIKYLTKINHFPYFI